MKAEILINTTKYHIDFSDPFDLSIPIFFNGDQPNTYAVEKASSVSYQDDAFVGDTRKGGPCNFETYTITPHCNGTHTECIGHITEERISLHSSFNDIFSPSTLITVQPVSHQETYFPKLQDSDFVITKEILENKLQEIAGDFLEGLIIRTLPNLKSKQSQDYMKNTPPFFTLEAMQYIRSRGVKHLLVDVPSVDRLFDDGHLSCHNIFWDTKNKKLNKHTSSYTITEMIYVDDQVSDGNYLLNIQVPSFVADAAPSRPIIFKLNEV